MREWLELYPEKVLFGTDGYPFSSSLGWEESTWLAARNARQALGLALTGMQRDGDSVSFFNETVQSAISMTSIQIAGA